MSSPFVRSCLIVREQMEARPTSAFFTCFIPLNRHSLGLAVEFSAPHTLYSLKLPSNMSYITFPPTVGPTNAPELAPPTQFAILPGEFVASTFYHDITPSGGYRKDLHRLILGRLFFVIKAMAIQYPELLSLFDAGSDEVIAVV